jgi:diguanylate cyclase (GGDEF)-like protein
MAETARPPVHDIGPVAGLDGRALVSLRERWPTLRFVDYASFALRLAIAGGLTILYAAGVIQPREGGALALIVGTAVLAAGGLGSALAFLVWQQQPRRVLQMVLISDLVSSALLIWALANYPDPLYPQMIGLALIFGSGLSQRDASIFAGLVGLTYLGAHFFGQGVMSPGVAAMLLAKAAAVVATAFVVATVQRAQAEREMHLRRSQREYHDLNENLRRRLTELRAISEITELIHSTLDFEQVGQLVLDILSKVIDLPGSALFIIDKERDETVFNASFGIAPGIAKHTPYTYGPDTQIHGEEMFACTTLMDRGGLMVIFCASGERLERLGSEDRLVLTSVANELAGAVENSELYKLTRCLAITDELTGLFNYRYLLERAEDEIGRAKRFGRSLSLLMIDADEFKVYNDTNGHVAGDQALAELATTMRSAVRDIDIVCRYGGEEFAILLPETDGEGAFVVAEKVREAVASHGFKNSESERTEQITVSIGLSTYPGTASDREGLLRRADDALYVVKRSGRNRVSASPAGVEEMRARDQEVERREQAADAAERGGL